MRIVETYLPGTAKGCCYLCSTSPRLVDEGRSQRRELVIDTGLIIDFEGGLAICESCVREAAHLVGMVDGGAAIDAEEAVIEARAAQAGAEAERDEAVAVAEALRHWDAKTPANEDGAEGSAADAAAAPRKRAPKAQA